MIALENHQDDTTQAWCALSAGLIVGVSVFREPSTLWLVLVIIFTASKVRSHMPRGIWLCAVLGCVLGGMRQTQFSSVHPPQSPKTVTEVWVVSSIQRGNDVRTILWHPSIEGYAVAIQKRCLFPPIRGTRFKTKGRLIPLMASGNPGQPNQVLSQNGERIRWRFVGQSPCPDTAESTTLIQTLRHRIRRALMSGENLYGRRLMTGILLGDRFNLSTDAVRAFEASGTGHLLAVSGLHVGSAALCSFWLVHILALRMRFRFPHRTAIGASLVSILVMLMLSQAPISAQRASIMLAAYLAGRACGIRLPTERCVAWAIIGVVWSDPSVIVSAAFQFSFLAVVGLVKWGGQHRGPLGWIRVALVAWIVTAPIQLWHFGTVAPTGIIANVILTPMTALYLVPLGLLGIIFAPFTQIPMDLAAKSAQLMVCIAEALVEQFGGTITLGRWVTPLFVLVPTILSLRKRLGCMLISSGVFILIAMTMKPPKTFVDFISVGQGDAILLVSNGRAALVDAGPDSKAYQIRAHLKYLGISRLEWILITHQHPDHFNGLETLIESVDVGAIYHGSNRESSISWKRTTQLVQHRGISLHEIQTSDQRMGSLHIRTFAPTASPHVNENDRSVAVRIDGLSSSVLLTGDLEHFGEMRLTAMNPGIIDVLKLGHHGSRTSTSDMLLDAVTPAVSVASCGRFNQYQFPHAEILNRMKSHDVDVLSTASHGLIRVIMDGPLAVQGMHPPVGYNTVINSKPRGFLDWFERHIRSFYPKDK